MKLLEMDFKHSQVWIKPTAQSNRQFSLVDTSADVMTTKLWQYYPEFASLGLRYYPLSDENEENSGAVNWADFKAWSGEGRHSAKRLRALLEAAGKKVRPGRARMGPGWAQDPGPRFR